MVHYNYLVLFSTLCCPLDAVVELELVSGQKFPHRKWRKPCISTFKCTQQNISQRYMVPCLAIRASPWIPPPWSYRPASLCSLAVGYDNPLPFSTIILRQGLIIWPQGALLLFHLVFPMMTPSGLSIGTILKINRFRSSLAVAAFPSVQVRKSETKKNTRKTLFGPNTLEEKLTFLTVPSVKNVF
jgi:hypothetical protein